MPVRELLAGWKPGVFGWLSVPEVRVGEAVTWLVGSMKLLSIVMPLEPSKTPTCEPWDPVMVLPVMDEFVVLKKRTPFPLLLMMLLDTVTLDCDCGWVEARFTPAPPLPVNVLLSIRTL